MSTNTVVVAHQPGATTVTVAAPQEDHSGRAMVALVLSIIGLVFCGYTLLVLACLIPALILAIIAVASPHEHSASTQSFFSIGLSITSIVSAIIIIIIVIVAPVVTVAAAVNSISTSRFQLSSGQIYHSI
jgi:uncharacterized membrane protein